MKTNKIKILIILFLLNCSKTEIIAQETKLIKLSHVENLGSTDTVDLMPLLINVNGNIVVSGNQKMNATQYDATTISQLNDGTSAWMANYNISNKKAFITASCNDAQGNIYTAGAIRPNATNGLDLLVMKYDQSGNVL